ncbi:MbtH family protein [Streptomyces sp. NPDC056708]|uniref:MbtH family protein n=1 Tax=unclassified Streptomyces TaxID=2593676 RepID=UPI0036B71CED
MTNPFDNQSGRFLVLVNAENEHSLWPAFAPVPEGWSVRHGECDRQSCLDYIEEQWVDMRPRSLAVGAPDDV